MSKTILVTMATLSVFAFGCGASSGPEESDGRTDPAPSEQAQQSNDQVESQWGRSRRSNGWGVRDEDDGMDCGVHDNGEAYCCRWNENWERVCWTP